MKALLRLSAMMGLIGAATIGSWFYAGQPAQALPTEKVVDILKQAPIFTVLTPQQQPIPLCQEEVSENKTCPPDKVNFIFFVNPQDAMTFKQAQVNQLPDGSEAKKQLQALNVGPVSLSVMYEYLVNTQDKENAPRMSLIPDEQQLEIAKNMMGQDFESIPIYLICYSNEEECQQPIFGDQLLPFFFEESEAKKFLAKLNKTILTVKVNCVLTLPD